MTSQHMNSARFPLLAFASSFLVLFLEAFYLSQTFDAYILIQSGRIAQWLSFVGYLGDFVRWAITFGVVAGILFYAKIPALLAFVDRSFNSQRFVVFGIAQVFIFGFIALLSVPLFSPESAGVKAPGWYLLWLALVGAAATCWLLMWCGIRTFAKFCRDQALTLIAAALIALAITLFAFATKSLWGPLATWTFFISAFTLVLLNVGEVTILEQERILGLDEFWVNIAPACSGYEGIGLVTAFTALYLYVNRATMRFPQCLILFPIGVVCIWLMNIIRIVVLIFIGAYWSPDIAVGGFHSFGGWIAFILVSLGLLKIASKSRWLNTRPLDTQNIKPAMNTAAASIVPMIVLLALTILTAALSADFEWLYPLRVIAVAASIAYVWRYLPLGGFRLTAVPLLVGFAVAALWFLLVPANPEQDQIFTRELRSAPVWGQYAWLGLRMLGAVVTVPIAEELAFRGYLMCRLAREPISLTGRLPFHALGFFGSSIAFGLLHGHWLAGIAAGLAYAWVRLRQQHLLAAIVAHGVTNATLFIVAFATGRWVLI